MMKNADAQKKVQTKNSELKTAAKKSLTGRWGLVILSMLAVVGVFIALPIVGSYIFSFIWLSSVGIVLGVIVGMVWCLISVAGFVHIYLNLCRNRGEETRVRDIFYVLSIKPVRFIGYYFRLFLYVLIGEVIYVVALVAVIFLEEAVPFFDIFYVPLFIAFIVYVFLLFLMYSQVMYLLVDDADMKVGEAFKKSVQLMRGNKLKYLGLNFSFILWYLLATVTIGIAYLYVAPYTACTNVQFYLELKKVNGMEESKMQGPLPDFGAEPQMQEQEAAEKPAD